MLPYLQYSMFFGLGSRLATLRCQVELKFAVQTSLALDKGRLSLLELLRPPILLGRGGIRE